MYFTLHHTPSYLTARQKIFREIVDVEHRSTTVTFGVSEVMNNCFVIVTLRHATSDCATRRPLVAVQCKLHAVNDYAIHAQ